MKSCQYPGCEASDEQDDDIHTFGLTVDGMVEVEWDYCPDHAPTLDSIDPSV